MDNIVNNIITRKVTISSAVGVNGIIDDAEYEYVPARIISLEGDALMSSEGDYVLCLVKQKIGKK